MSDDQVLKKEEIQKIPSKLMMLLRLSQFVGEGRASVDDKYKNVVKLNSFLSNTFSIGRDDDQMAPFLGIQDKMLPWFFEAEWDHAYLCINEGFLYLASHNELSQGIVLAIKIRKKRMSILWPQKVEGERQLRMKIFKMITKSEYQISKKIYATLGISMVKSIDEFMAGNEVVITKDDDNDDDFSSAEIWE
jgi:hypothetical protein